MKNSVLAVAALLVFWLSVLGNSVFALTTLPESFHLSFKIGGGCEIYRGETLLLDLENGNPALFFEEDNDYRITRFPGRMPQEDMIRFWQDLQSTDFMNLGGRYQPPADASRHTGENIGQIAIRYSDGGKNFEKNIEFEGQVEDTAFRKFYSVIDGLKKFKSAFTREECLSWLLESDKHVKPGEKGPLVLGASEFISPQPDSKYVVPAPPTALRSLYYGAVMKILADSSKEKGFAADVIEILRGNAVAVTKNICLGILEQSHFVASSTEAAGEFLPVLGNLLKQCMAEDEVVDCTLVLRLIQRLDSSGSFLQSYRDSMYEHIRSNKKDAQAFLDTLIATGDQKLVPFLKELIEKDIRERRRTDDIWMAAVAGLVSIQQKEAVPYLEGIIEQNPAATVARHLTRALTRIKND